MTKPEWMFSLSELINQFPDNPDVMRFHYAFRHGTMKIGVYGPRDIDTQTPHKQDELYIIAKGSGFFIKNGERLSFTSNDAIFVEAGADHRFVNFTEDFLTWVIFWGREGGET